MTPTVESGLKLVALWWLMYPATACTLSAIFAGPVAAAEDASYEDCFLFFLMAFTLTAIPLTSWAPTGTGGIVITLFTAIFVILVQVVFIGLSAGPLADPFVNAFSLTPRSHGHFFKAHVRHRASRPFPVASSAPT